MKPMQRQYYSPVEESINIISHAAGILLSIAGLIIMVIHANLHGSTRHVVSFSIFGASLILLYSASTIYHSVKKQKLRSVMRIIDHASIYILIAGSYTPFALIVLDNPERWLIFGISWGLALNGIILKLFFTGKFETLSTLMYVGMGWLILFAIKPLVHNFSTEGLTWLFASGALYTLGALLYAVKRISLNHAIFHLFVLAGSVTHFVSVFFYVLPVD